MTAIPGEYLDTTAGGSGEAAIRDIYHAGDVFGSESPSQNDREIAAESDSAYKGTVPGLPKTSGILRRAQIYHAVASARNKATAQGAAEQAQIQREFQPPPPNLGEEENVRQLKKTAALARIRYNQQQNDYRGASANILGGTVAGLTGAENALTGGLYGAFDSPGAAPLRKLFPGYVPGSAQIIRQSQRQFPESSATGTTAGLIGANVFEPAGVIENLGLVGRFAARSAWNAYLMAAQAVGQNFMHNPENVPANAALGAGYGLVGEAAQAASAPLRGILKQGVSRGINALGAGGLAAASGSGPAGSALNAAFGGTLGGPGRTIDEPADTGTAEPIKPKSEPKSLPKKAADAAGQIAQTLAAPPGEQTQSATADRVSLAEAPRPVESPIPPTPAKVLPVPEPVNAVEKPEPKAAEPAAAPNEAPAKTAPIAGSLHTVPIDSLQVDPKRFQFRSFTNQKGVAGHLEGAKKFNPALSGVISVWRDPADGKNYVVNGHHRFDLAVKNGAKNIDVKFIDAPDARSARLIGALQNVAEGKGTAIDAAKLFRESKLSQNDIENMGVTLKERMAQRGLALSKLAPSLFHEVALGRFPEDRGVTLGENIADEDTQIQIANAIEKMEKKGKKVSDAAFREMLLQARNAGGKDSEADLFGNSTWMNAALERGRITAAIEAKVKREAGTLGMLSSEDRARIAAEHGIGELDTKRSASEAKVAQDRYQNFVREKNRLGSPIAEILTDAADQVQSKKGTFTSVVDQASEKIKEELDNLEYGTGAPKDAGLFPIEALAQRRTPRAATILSKLKADYAANPNNPVVQARVDLSKAGNYEEAATAAAKAIGKTPIDHSIFGTIQGGVRSTLLRGRAAVAKLSEVTRTAFAHDLSETTRETQNRLAKRESIIQRASATYKEALAGAAKVFHDSGKPIEYAMRLDEGYYDPRNLREVGNETFSTIDGKKIDPQIMDAIKLLREQDTWRQQFQKMNVEDQIKYVRNYMAHLYVHTADSDATYRELAKRTVAPGGFRQHRIIPTLREAMEAGLVPVSDNPVVLDQLHNNQFVKYYTTRQIFDWQKNRPVLPAKYVPVGEALEAGYSTPNNALYTVTAPESENIVPVAAYQAVSATLKNLGTDWDRVNLERYLRAKNIPKSPIALYDPNENRIYSQSGAPLAAVAHEIGHAVIHKIFKNDPEALLKQLTPTLLEKTEMQGLLTTIMKRESIYQTEPREQLAELFEAWMGLPQTFEAIAPHVKENFRQMLVNNPNLWPLTHNLESFDTMKLPGAPGFKTLGHWSLPKDETEVINRHLDPGFADQDTLAAHLARGAIRFKVLTNSLRIGMGVAHAVGRMVSTSSLHLALATEDASRAIARGEIPSAAGKFGLGLKELPLTVPDGIRMLKEYRSPGTQEAQYQEAMEHAINGGMAIGGVGNLGESITDAIHRDAPTALSRGIARAVDIGTLHTLNTVIPALKLGTFMHFYNSEVFNGLRENLTPAQTMARDNAIVRLLDAKFGHMNKENLELSSNARTAMKLLIGYPDWTIGRALALTQPGAELVRFVRGQRDFPRWSASLLATVGTTALIASVAYWLEHGKYPTFKQMVDPEYTTLNSQKELVPIAAEAINGFDAGGMSRSVHWGVEKLTEEAYNKLNPSFQAAYNLIQNRDWYGNQIYSPQSDLLDKIKAGSLYLLGSVLPFSLKNALNMPPATPWYMRNINAFMVREEHVPSSAAEDLLKHESEAAGTHAPMTPQQEQNFELKRFLTEKIRANRQTGMRELGTYLRGGKISVNEAKEILKTASQPLIVNMATHLAATETFGVWRAATPAEKTELLPLFRRKWINYLRSNNTTPAQKSIFRQRLAELHLGH